MVPNRHDLMDRLDISYISFFDISFDISWIDLVRLLTLIIALERERERETKVIKIDGTG